MCPICHSVNLMPILIKAIVFIPRNQIVLANVGGETINEKEIDMARLTCQGCGSIFNQQIALMMKEKFEELKKIDGLPA